MILEISRSVRRRCLIGIAVAAIIVAAGRSAPCAADDTLTLLRIDSARFAFLQHCSRCHEPERGYRAVVDRAVWERIVRRMAGSDNMWIDRESEEQIVRYVSEYDAYQWAFFESRCIRCHSREGLGASLDGAADWCRRMAAAFDQGYGLVTGEECALIVAGLRDRVAPHPWGDAEAP